MAKQREGYLLLDHRASPGLPANMAARMGASPNEVREGAYFETHTMGCAHCPSVVVLNPMRTRGRSWCSKCDSYICDWCEAFRHEPGYVHRTRDELLDLLTSGKWDNLGSLSRPLLVPKRPPAAVCEHLELISKGSSENG
jgi:hypothetical protein